MRVIAGSLGGRVFDSPRGYKTHPMSEKIRGAIFNILGDISGLTILDCYSGSGALAIEAISRGAGSAIAIDNDKTAHQTITKNISSLGLESTLKAIRANVTGWSDNNAGKFFNIVFMDPPYDAIKPAAIEKLANHAQAGGLVVLSLPPSSNLSLTDNFELITKKDYGDAALAFYRRVS